MSLADQKCIPCRGGVPPLSEEESRDLLPQIEEGWQLNAEGHLARVFGFRTFNAAMKLANAVAEIADDENHHPDLYIAWGTCAVEIWTHKINGLTQSDFYFAAKVDRAANELID